MQGVHTGPSEDLQCLQRRGRAAVLNVSLRSLTLLTPSGRRTLTPPPTDVGSLLCPHREQTVVGDSTWPLRLGYKRGRSVPPAFSLRTLTFL